LKHASRLLRFVEGGGRAAFVECPVCHKRIGLDGQPLEAGGWSIEHVHARLEQHIERHVATGQRDVD